MIIDGLDKLFYEKMCDSFHLAPIARIVSSAKEARRVHSWHDDKINNRFNRFSLAYYTVANRHTHMNFSLYVDIANKKIYVFFDEIETERMILPEKQLPQCYCELSISDFYEDVTKFLANDFSTAIKEYYSGSKFGFDRFESSDQGLYSLCKFGDASGLAYFGSQTGFRKLNFAFYPELDPEENNNRSGNLTEYGKLTCNTISLSVSHDLTGKYTYVTDGLYLWSIGTETFDRFMTGYRSAIKEGTCLDRYGLLLLES